ncbi:MAG: 50S ribosomal protein L28 [Spirochaetales bacterium]|nr:50S ribosomal protein L28 [Spirochaetales bacterium]
MARRCQISGKGTTAGNSLSHSHIRTKRKFKINLVKKKIFLPDENRTVTLRISARMLKSLNRTGVKALLKKHGQDAGILRKA